MMETGAVLIPVAVWCAMLIYDHFDPMCGAGGIACALRALAVTAISVVPGLLIGAVAGCFLSPAAAVKAREGRRHEVSCRACFIDDLVHRVCCHFRKIR
jgi:hypothetical protein